VGSYERMHTAVLHPLAAQNMGSLSTMYTIYNLRFFNFIYLFLFIYLFFYLSIILVLQKEQHTEILESYSGMWCMNFEWSEFLCLSLCEFTLSCN